MKIIITIIILTLIGISIYIINSMLNKIQKNAEKLDKQLEKDYKKIEIVRKKLGKHKR